MSLSPIRRLAALLPLLVLFAATPQVASAQAPTAIGALSNFDVFNTTGELTHGFEIELEGLSSSDISYTFGGSYLRYGTPQIVNYATGVYVRYQSPYDPATQSFVEATQIAPTPITATDGHSCFQGTGVNYATSGCEHFGVGTLRNPTKTTYRWLVADPTSPGSLRPSGTQVSIPAPIWNVQPAPVGAPNPAPVVAAVIEAPDPPEAYEFGEPMWVKVFVTETETEIDLESLLTDNPAVPQTQSETEVEWILLQQDKNRVGAGELNNEQQMAEAGKTITRRYEFYAYTGPFDPETHEALAISDSNPSEGEVGDYLGAQMAALVLDPVAPIMVSASPLPDGQVGDAYSAPLFTGGLGGDLTATTTAGTLPEGLTVQPDGTLAGTPTTAGTSTFTIDVTNDAGQTASGAFELTIGSPPPPPPAIIVSPSGLADGQVGTPYSATLVSGGTPPFDSTVTAGAVPDGLAINPDGTLNGTPTAAGTSTFTISVTDAAGQTTSGSFEITVGSPPPPPPAIVVSPSGLSDGQVGTPYSATLLSGGTPPFDSTVTAGAVPEGLVINPDGTLTGTPTAAATSTFTINVVDTAGQTTSGSFQVTIAASPPPPPPAIIVSPSGLADGQVGTAYSATLVDAGTPPFTSTVTAGELPAGLSINADGTLTGTPTAAGTSAFTISVSDAAGQTAGGSFQVTVNAQPAASTVRISTRKLRAATRNHRYRVRLRASGGTPRYTWSATGDPLPAGLSLNADTGVISGRATTRGRSTIRFTATDSTGHTGSRTLTLTVRR